MIWLLAGCAQVVEKPSKPQDTQDTEFTEPTECDPYEQCCPMDDPDTGLLCVPEFCCAGARGCLWSAGDLGAWECGEGGERPCYEALHLALEACGAEG